MIEKTPGWTVFRFAIALPAVALAIALAFVPAPAAAQSGTEPGAENTLPPGTWVKRCSKRGEQTFCEISFGRVLTVGDRQVWVSRAGVFESGDSKDLFIFSPLGSALRRGLAFRIDDTEPKTAAYSVCLQLQGCQAVTVIDEAMIAALKRGKELQIQFTLGNQPPLITKVSLTGFTAAYDGAPAEIIDQTPQDGAAGNAAPAAAGSGGKGDAPTR